MRYREIVLETMDQPYPWNAYAQFKGCLNADFTTDDGNQYLVDITSSRPDGPVDVAFRLSGGDRHWWKLAGTGDSFRVMATVKEILEQYVVTYHPDIITFEAEEGSRTRLYSRMLRDIPGYTVATREGSVGTKFVLTRN